jgi:hypothetical protein
VTYGTAPFEVTANDAAGSSTATVTISNFNSATDKIFHSSQSSASDSSIIATSTKTTVLGQSSTIITLPDGTTMTLLGFTGSLTGLFTKYPHIAGRSAQTGKQ